MKYKNHPTVENIFHELEREIPTLSKTTIYNTLNLFKEKNIIQLIGIEENETRYDADTSEHAHFKCKACGKIFDVFTDYSKIPTKELEHFQVDDMQVYFKGLCEECINKGEGERRL